MTGTNHTLVGSIVAIVTPLPLVPVIALASHFVCDALPHFGQNSVLYIRSDGRYSRGFMLWLCADAIGCIVVLSGVLLFFPNAWLNILLGVFFAVIPDVGWMFQTKLRRIPFFATFLHFSKKIQWAEWAQGWILELLYMVMFAYILLKLQ